MLLTDYYDALYGYTLKKMSYIATLVNNDSEETAGQVISVIKNYLKASFPESLRDNSD